MLKWKEALLSQYSAPNEVWPLEASILLALMLWSSPPASLGGLFQSFPLPPVPSLTPEPPVHWYSQLSALPTSFSNCNLASFHLLHQNRWPTDICVAKLNDAFQSAGPLSFLQLSPPWVATSPSPISFLSCALYTASYLCPLGCPQICPMLSFPLAPRTAWVSSTTAMALTDHS